MELKGSKTEQNLMTAPELCPVCAHPKAYFQVESQNY